MPVERRRRNDWRSIRGGGTGRDDFPLLPAACVCAREDSFGGSRRRLWAPTDGGSHKDGAVVDAARDRYAIGLIVGGDEGTVLCSDAEALVRSKGAVKPVTLLTSQIPELTRYHPPA